MCISGLVGRLIKSVGGNGSPCFYGPAMMKDMMDSGSAKIFMGG